VQQKSSQPSAASYVLPAAPRRPRNLQPLDHDEQRIAIEWARRNIED
jgi:hypothetical protein